MDLASIFYLGVTLLFVLVFAAIAVRTFSRKRKIGGEQAKFRMMDDEYPKDETEKKHDKSAKEDDNVRRP